MARPPAPRPARIPLLLRRPRGALAAVAAATGVAAAALLAPACADTRPPSPLQGRLVDLTHAFGEETLYWPTDTRGFVLEELARGRTEAGYWYAANRLSGAEHGGTHLDAPIHFAEGRRSAEAVPLSQLVAPAVRIDVRAAAAADRDLAVGPAPLEAFEARHGRIEPGTIVLLDTGWGARWPDRERYLGTAARGPEAVADLHFPGLGADGARLLVARGVAAVGIDTASIDAGPSRDFAAHRVLAAAEIPIFENVASLDGLPARGFHVVALPMKIRGGSGGPLRIIAVVPPEG